MIKLNDWFTKRNDNRYIHGVDNWCFDAFLHDGFEQRHMISSNFIHNRYKPVKDRCIFKLIGDSRVHQLSIKFCTAQKTADVDVLVDRSTIMGFAVHRNSVKPRVEIYLTKGACDISATTSRHVRAWVGSYDNARVVMGSLTHTPNSYKYDGWCDTAKMSNDDACDACMYNSFVPMVI